MLRRILVPVDGTEFSWRALEYAVRLAELTSCSLVVMTVVAEDIPQPVIECEGDVLYAQMGDDVLDAVHAVLHSKNIDCTYLLVNGGSVAEAILDVVDSEDCDGIVMGSKGKGLMRGLLHKSVSYAVLAQTKVPITIVK